MPDIHRRIYPRRLRAMAGNDVSLKVVLDFSNSA
jgi:hypothetical protein